MPKAITGSKLEQAYRFGRDGKPCPPRLSTPGSPVYKEYLRGRREAKRGADNAALKKALGDLLDMLAEWDSGGDGMSGFAGMNAVVNAEILLGREQSTGD